MRFLYEDTETFSDVPLGTHGLHAYSEGNEAPVEVMIFAYAYDDDEPTVLDLTNGDVIPQEVIDDQNNPDVIKVFHNSPFDRTVMRFGLDITIPVEEIHDTMVQALSHALPAGLEPLGEAMRLKQDEAKSKAGKALIQLFCKPRPKRQKRRRATSESHPKEWQEFLDYAGMDIISMRACHKMMPQRNYVPKEHGPNLHQGDDRKLWELDQKINDRGFKVDLELARAAMETAEKHKDKLAVRTQELTKDEVKRATQRDKLLKYILREHGVFLPDMKKSTIERRLDDPNLPRAVKELLAIRLAASTTSTSKYKKLLQATAADGRLKGSLQYAGAARTRRWAGRLFQPQNLPRPTHKPDEIEEAIRALKDGTADLMYDNEIMEVISSCVRGCIIPEEGNKLCVSDLSNIEGRFAAWICEEKWKLRAFHAYDEGLGPDLYVRAYANMFGIDPSQVNDHERQIGKVTELMLGYQGGVGAFLTGALTYNIDLEELAEIAWPEIPETFKREASGFLDWTKQQRRSTFGLSNEVFMTCDALKRMWREAHPGVVSFWHEIENIVCKAILNRDKEYWCRRLRVFCKGAWLYIELPSGHCLCYPSPRLEGNKISYMGQNQYTRKWQRIDTYGGKFLENICQSGSRDVMAYNMPYAEAEGYEIVLTVHDELISEAPDTSDYGHEALSRILATNPDWAPDMPLAAGGYEGYRYRKD